MKLFQALSVFIVLFALSACGGGGGTSIEQEKLKRLYLIDSPINGVKYKCGVRESLTESVEIDGVLKHGVAQCRNGSVTFSIGDFVLGTIDEYYDHQTIYLADFVDISNGLVGNEALIKLGMLLQSLDDDGDIQTKIDIDRGVDIVSLEEYTLTSLQEYIQTLGKVARTPEDVLEHIIAHIDPKYGKKPTLEAMQWSVSLDEAVGNTIGTIALHQGDGELLSLKLSGEGSEHFEIINIQEIRLKQKLTQATTFNLLLTATNSFGQSSANLTIHVTAQGKPIQIEPGKLTGATVKIYRLDENANAQLIAATTSDEQGYFDPHTEALEAQSLYIYEISGGQTSDSDIDNDGIKDSFKTPNQGVIRLIATKEGIEHSTHALHASTLSETLYLYAVAYLKGDVVTIKRHLNRIAHTLLDSDLNGDGKIDTEDILIFNPRIHSDRLSPSLAKAYNDLSIMVLFDDSRRFKRLFDTKVIQSFEANASGCSPTTLCAFETQPTKIKYRNAIVYAFKKNRLFIYDTLKQKTLGSIDLNSSEYGLYLDWERGYIFASSPNHDIVAVDIGTLEEPKIAPIVFPTQGLIIGKIASSMLIYQEPQLIVVDSDTIHSIKETARYTLSPFHRIIRNDAYALSIANNTLSIEQYTLKDPNQIAQTHRYTIENVDNNAQFAMDEAKNIYIVTPHQSLSIYQIVDEQPSQVSTLEFNATEIVNITDTQLYAYGNRTIYQVDIANPHTPRLLSSFDFEQTTTDLYFDEQILYTPRYMIDTDALMLSSPYLTIDATRAFNQEYDINLETIRDNSIFAPIFALH